MAQFFGDRIRVVGWLIVVCFASVLALASQSAASLSTYVLALVMLASFASWRDVFAVRFLWLVCALVAYLTLTAFWSEPFDARGLFSTVVRALLITTCVVAFAECQWRGEVQRWLGRALAVVGSVAVFAAIVVFFVTNPEDGRLNGL